MEYVTRSCICRRGLEFAARAASAARTACNPVRIRDVKGKKRNSTNFAFFRGEMCRVSAGAMLVPCRAVPCRALSGLGGARPALAGTLGPRPAGSGRGSAPAAPAGCGEVRVCRCVDVWVCADSAGPAQVAAEQGASLGTRTAAARLCAIATFTDTDSGTAALSRTACPQAAPLRNVTLLRFWVSVEASLVCSANPGHVACASGAERLSAARFSGGILRESMLLGRNRPNSARGTVLRGRPGQGQCYRQGVRGGKASFGLERILARFDLSCPVVARSRRWSGRCFLLPKPSNLAGSLG